MDSPDLSLLTPSQEGQLWTVIHCRPRCEKKVLGLQKLRPADMFLPFMERVHNYGGRIRKNRIPLFTGYVFAKLKREDVQWYQQNQYIARVMEVVDERKLLEPLQAVATALNEGKKLEVLPQLRPGQRVQITGGSMKGLEAEIGDIKGEQILMLQIEMIQQTVVLELDASFVKPID